MHGAFDQTDKKGDLDRCHRRTYEKGCVVTHQSGSSQGQKVIIRVDHDIADLIPGFLNNRRRDVLLILEALAKEDFNTIRTLGHRMKGDGGGYGFQAITVMGGAIEQAAKERQAKDIRRGVDELSDYLDRIEVVYD
jgi:HPt (histidine-containing phosphotransfer) domain-containing protein